MLFSIEHVAYTFSPKENTMTTFGRIEISHKVMLGKPVIRGTRIPLEIVLRRMSEGMTERELLDAYPNMRKGDVAAALRYPADVIAHKKTVVFEPAEDTA